MRHERDVPLFGDAAFYLASAKRIGTVQHHQFLALIGAGLHQHAKGGDIGVGAAAVVLDIVNQHIHVAEHLRRSFARLAVERIRGQTRLLVDTVVHQVTRMRIAAYAVLRAVQRHQVDFGCLKEDIDGGLELTVHTRRVGHQPHTFATKNIVTAVTKHLDARFNYRTCRICRAVRFHNTHAHTGQSHQGQNAHQKKDIRLIFHTNFI